MMGRRVRLGAGAVALLLVACGGSTASDGETGGASGTSGTGGAGGSGAQGGSGGAGGGGGSSGSGGSAGFGGTGTGAQGGSGGGTSADCDKLASRYAETLGLAKQCNPFIDFEQCTVLVQSDLYCGCPTFVSSGQQVAISDLSKLQNEWQALNCGADILCEPCAAPNAGSCQVGGNSGSCIDVF